MVNVRILLNEPGKLSERGSQSVSFNSAPNDGHAPPGSLPIEVIGGTVMLTKRAKYQLGQVVRHRKHPFRGVVFDVDPEFSNTDEWYESIPEESRPRKEQPFYHLLAENEQNYYVAYVSEQNLVADYSGEPVSHPDLSDLFGDFNDGHYALQLAFN